MTRRFPRAKWVLPEVVNPPERLCFQIEVPKERMHIAAFRGALLNLASAVNWQDDPDHTAKDVANVWKKIVAEVQACIECDTSTGILLEDFMSQQIRISPDDSCIIQMWCIDHWEDWYDPRSCIAGNVSQPAPGTALEPGECRTYHVVLQANSKWLMPLSVQSGVTVQISNASGGWSDGTIEWNCPNGFTYALGACVSADAPHAGDPLQTENHMRLIAEYNGVFYDAYNTTIPIFGSTPGNLFFQANDEVLEDNQGSVSFDVTVCNSEPSGEWIFRALGGYDNHTKLTPFSFEGGDTEYVSGTDSYDAVDVTPTLFSLGLRANVSDDTEITKVQIVVQYSQTVSGTARPASLIFDAATIEDKFDSSEEPGQVTFNWSGTATITDKIEINGGCTGGYDRCVYWEVRGTGFNPFA